MGDELRYIVPSPAGTTFEPVDEVPVKLARQRRVQGRLFEKHILTKGDLIHPKTGARIQIDDDFVRSLQDNFARGVCDIVQVPLANDQNEHVENAAANLGEVVGIRERDGKVYALIDARREADRFGKTYLGASAFLSTDYTDSSTGQKAGPTLLHVAVTNRPYVTGLEDYREVLEASADNTGEVVVLTPPEETQVPLTKEQLLEQLKTEHGIDVEALQVAATAEPIQLPDQGALAASVVQALKDAGVQLSAGQGEGELQLSDVTAAVIELAADNKGLRGDVAGLKRQAAEGEIDGYISEGRLLPKTRATAVELALTNRDALAAIVAPADEPYVRLAHQQGITGPDGEQRQEQDVDGELARLTAEHSQFFSPNGTKAK
jgi:Mu-like prophage I protein